MISFVFGLCVLVTALGLIALLVIFWKHTAVQSKVNMEDLKEEWRQLKEDVSDDSRE